MRWDSLFSDLEAQLDAERQALDRAQDADRARAERAGIDLADRWRARRGDDVHLLLVTSAAVSGRVLDAAPGWLLVGEESGAQALVPAAAVVALRGLGREVAAPPGQVESRLGIGRVLRALAQDRAGVRVDLVGGTSLTGTLDRVGSDHVDLAEHPPEEARRGAQVRAVWSIRFAGIVTVRSRPW